MQDQSTQDNGIAVKIFKDKNQMAISTQDNGVAIKIFNDKRQMDKEIVNEKKIHE